MGGPSWIATVPPLARGQIQHQGCRTPQSLLGIEPFQSRLDSFLLGFHAQTWPALELLTPGVTAGTCMSCYSPSQKQKGHLWPQLRVSES